MPAAVASPTASRPARPARPQARLRRPPGLTRAFLAEAVALGLHPLALRSFLRSCQRRPRRSFRINGCRFDRSDGKEFLGRLRSDGFRPSPAPWCGDGFLVEDGEDGASLSSLQLSGAVYLQELASMLPVQVLWSQLPQTGDLRCLDLCAAPGSKATQLLTLLRLRGSLSSRLLVANDSQPQRSDVLRCNVVRSGVAEDCLILQESGQCLGDLAPGCFDAVLLDAPCSAEGNLRRYPEVLDRILSEGYQQCVRSNSEVQWELLQSAWKLLRPGGTLVYSTCTLNSQENETPCRRLLQHYPSAEVVDLRCSLGVDATGTKDGFLRVWPHAFDTMGFFVACFRRQWEPGMTGSPSLYDQKLAVDWLRLQAEEIRRMREGAESAGVTWPISDSSERLIVSKDGAAFLLPRLEGLPRPLLLRCPRPGLCVGPDHAELRLATAKHLDTEEWAELNASQGGGLGAFGALMDLRARKGDVRGAEEVLVQIRQQRMKPDVISYNTLLKAYAAVKDCDGAVRILASMRNDAVPPDNVSFSTAMQACVAAGRSKAAEKLSADLRSARLQPDLMTCTTLIRSYAADSRRTDAEALLQQMKLDALQPDVACYTALMDLYASVRDRVAAEGLLNNMSVAPNVITYGVLLKLYAAEADAERAEDTLRAMRRTSLQPNFLCYTALLGAYAKRGDILRATGVAEELQSIRLQPDVVTQSSLILAHTRAGDLQGAEEVLKGMSAWGLLPNVVCFATILDGYARRGDVPQAERLLSALRSQGLRPNVVVASAMAKCRANAGDFAGATEELRRFRSLGLVPSQRSFAPVLAACARAGDAEAAARLRALVSAQGLRLDLPCTERTQPHFFIRLIYATTDGSNIFTPEYLKRIKRIEDRLETLPGYRRFCLADGNGRCVRPLSAVNYFFASMDASTGTITPDGRGEHLLPIQAILANLGTSNSYFVDRYFGVSSGQLKSALEGNVTRSVLRFGLPLRPGPNTALKSLESAGLKVPLLSFAFSGAFGTRRPGLQHLTNRGFCT
ncbi:rsmF [Symbiodinium sp. CCMP2456]|nr:rsmF [Symbiodinium sp. CCMP2456]